MVQVQMDMGEKFADVFCTCQELSYAQIRGDFDIL